MDEIVRGIVDFNIEYFLILVVFFPFSSNSFSHQFSNKLFSLTFFSATLLWFKIIFKYSLIGKFIANMNEKRGWKRVYAILW